MESAPKTVLIQNWILTKVDKQSASGRITHKVYGAYSRLNISEELLRQYDWALKPKILEGQFLLFYMAITAKVTNQGSLADEDHLDVRPGTLSRWLNGKAKLGDRPLHKMARIISNKTVLASGKPLSVTDFKNSYYFLKEAREQGAIHKEQIPNLALEFLKALELPVDVGQLLPTRSSRFNAKRSGNKGAANGADELAPYERPGGSKKVQSNSGLAEADSQGGTLDEEVHQPVLSPPRIAPSDADELAREPAKPSNSSFPWFRLAAAVATSAFVVVGSFSSNRIWMAERLAGLEPIHDATEWTQFDEQANSALSSLGNWLGFEVLRREARADAPRALYLLGMAHLLGAGIEKDIEAAERFLKEGYELASPGASVAYAYMLMNGTGSEFNPEKAAEIYQEQADKKNPTAINQIGRLYETGYLRPYNPSLALQLYEEAAELGNGFAHFNLGNLYWSGVFEHVEVDREKSRFHYEQALLDGVEGGRTGLARYYCASDQPTEALRLFEEGVARNQTIVMLDFAKNLLHDDCLEQDVERGRNLLEEAVARGNGDAAVDLVELIESFGLTSEFSRIPELLQFADANGGSWTQAELAFRAEHDDELHGRAGIAERHYQKASDSGHGRAAYRLAAMILDGRLPGRPGEDAIELLRRGVARGDPYAQWRYALILLDKEKEPTDSSRGLEMLRTAGMRGDDWVTNNVGAVFDGSKFGQGELVEIDEAEAAYWYLQAYQREGYRWAACNYISNEIERDPTLPLSQFNEMLESGVRSGNRGCLSVIFDDPTRTATWGKSYDELISVLNKYVDAGSYSAINRYHILGSSQIAPDNASPMQAENYVELLRRAADGGSTKAMLQLDYGFYVERDGDTRRRVEFDIPLNERIAWLRLAASKGNLDAISELIPEAYQAEPARFWFDDLVQTTKVTENPYRQFVVGLILDHGADGVDRDLSGAETWFRKASRTDNNARVRLARLLAEGCNRAPDYDTSVELIAQLPEGELRDFAIGALHLMVSNDTSSDVVDGLRLDVLEKIRELASENFIELSQNDYAITTRCQRTRRATPIDVSFLLGKMPELSDSQKWFLKEPFEYLYPHPYIVDYRE